MAFEEWLHGWHPLQELAGIHRRIGGMLEGRWEPRPLGLRQGSEYPPVNIYLTGESIVVAAELPGIAPDQVDIPDVDIFEEDDKLVLLADVPGVSRPETRVEGDQLIIEAISEYAEPEEAERLYREFGPRNFRRSFTLSADIDRDHISASAADGVLRVEMPKCERARVHKIKVEQG